jgi:hypothetical protein
MELKTRPRRVSCLISLADSTILEIDIDWHSSVGQDIVNRVSERFNIQMPGTAGVVAGPLFSVTNIKGLHKRIVHHTDTAKGKCHYIQSIITISIEELQLRIKCGKSARALSW